MTSSIVFSPGRHAANSVDLRRLHLIRGSSLKTNRFSGTLQLRICLLNGYLVAVRHDIANLVRQCTELQKGGRQPVLQSVLWPGRRTHHDRSSKLGASFRVSRQDPSLGDPLSLIAFQSSYSISCCPILSWGPTPARQGRRPHPWLMGGLNKMNTSLSKCGNPNPRFDLFRQSARQAYPASKDYGDEKDTFNDRGLMWRSDLVPRRSRL